jgi:hypothetical protein
MTQEDRDLFEKSAQLARMVLDGQARNYSMMQSLLRLLVCLLIVTAGLFLVLLVQTFR